MIQKQKKKLDSRIPALIQTSYQKSHRSFFVIVGDRGRDQAVTLHYLLSKQSLQRPSVLWCYKKELSFSSHRKKRNSQIKREIARGTREEDEDDPFDLFINSTSIRYCYYKEADEILGNTYGMLILQDFEALTPNLLAKTIETVQGGGVVVLLLKTMNSLKQLYSMSMDVHSRYRTEANQDVVARFNERFILSLGGCERCLVVDDELNVLPISKGKDLKMERMDVKVDQELIDLKEDIKDTEPVGSLVSLTRTVDQAKAVLTFVEAIAEKTLSSTVTLTAARGRGKSAALGIAIAAAVSYGYSNIFITSPSPENLKTLFEFILKGFDKLGYEEHLDYDILQSSNPKFQKAIVRVNIFRDHRQTIQWIQPSDYGVLAQAELVVIDEAAAIPLPTVKKLLGPYLVFMASTINGYEGTGRSLSLKLIKQLREQSVAKQSDTENNVRIGRDGKATKSSSKSTAMRSLREIKLEEPIRYSVNDPVEKWLNKLLCLDCCTPVSNRMISGCPHPSDCELYYVTRDTLFSYHPVSEKFLQMMMNLYVSSHYKNTPNDLQLLSDAPAHHLFVLLPPTDEKRDTLPEPLCVVQICMEGQIARKSALAALSRGVRASGDLIPWVVSQQFQDDDFASLSGARVVRIATHPDYAGMGYGSRALEQLEAYYSGKLYSMDESVSNNEDLPRVDDEDLREMSLKDDKIGVRDPENMPPLLLRLSERPPKEVLQWLGVSYGITQQLHKFWKRSGYTPVYVRQTSNELTGEHTCIMLKEINKTLERKEWLDAFSWDFRKRFIELLAYQFREFSPSMVLGILESSKSQKSEHQLVDSLEISRFFTPFDMKRLESYSKNLLDYHVILDLVPAISRLYYLNMLQGVDLSAVQGAIFVGLGLQKKSVDDLEGDLKLAVSQLLALFAKGIRKVSNSLRSILEEDVKIEMEVLDNDQNEKVKDINDDKAWEGLDTMDEELEEKGNEAMQALREKQRGDEKDWENVKPSTDSKIVGIPNKNSSKKRKMDGFKDTYEGIAGKIGKEIHDPKGIVAKVKAKKQKQKSKKENKNK